MLGLTAVECPAAPDQNKRFLVCYREIYGDDLSDATFVESKKAIWRDSQGRWHARNATDTNIRIVNDCRKRAAAGAPETWLSSARVVEYSPSNYKFIVVYDGVVKQTTAEPEVPRAFRAADGTWRVPPTANLSKGAREWVLPVAHIDRNTNQPFADRFNGSTKLEVLEKLFSSPIPWVVDLTKTYPLAPPEDIPQPVESVVEKPMTAAEIAAIQPFDWSEFDKMPSEIYKRNYILDERFRVACDKMFALRKGFEDRIRAKEESEATQQAIEAEKKKYLREEENERLKSGGA